MTTNEEEGPMTYWLIPVKSSKTMTSDEIIETLINREQIYAFGPNSNGKKQLKNGDWVCFYVGKKGIVAHAKATSSPTEKLYSYLPHLDKYPWVFHLSNVILHANRPLRVTRKLRIRLDAFQNKNVDERWSWFVQKTHKITKHDFDVLTRSN